MVRGFVSEVFSSFQGEGLFAGRRHAFLRMAGCNLRCSYCDTPESLERSPECTVYATDGSTRALPNPIDVEALAPILGPFLSAPGTHALAITGGEPLVQASFVAELLRAVHSTLPVLLETNGTYPGRLAAVLPFVDIVSMDVKLPSNSKEPPYWAEHREFLSKSLGKTVYIKVPVDDETSDEEVSAAARLVAEANRRVSFFLQPIVSPEGEITACAERLERFYELAVEHLEDVRVMPQAHKVLGIR